MQRWIIGIIILLLLITGGIYLAKQNRDGTTESGLASTPSPTKSPSPTATTPTNTTTSGSPSPTTSETSQPLLELTFDPAKKSAHYVSNTPAHAEILTTSPTEVVIRFNFDLAVNSTISIMKDKIEFGAGETKVSADRRSLSRPLGGNLSNGVYTVSYTACWPDKSCHDGQFQFGVDQT